MTKEKLQGLINLPLPLLRGVKWDHFVSMGGVPVNRPFINKLEVG